MKFMLVMKQVGEGCDHTIGCGYRYYSLKATDLEAAKSEAKTYLQGVQNDGYTCGFEGCRLIDHEFGYNIRGPYRPKLAWVDLVSIEEKLPIDAWFEESVEQHVKAQRLKEEAKERQEYERLAAKYAK